MGHRYLLVDFENVPKVDLEALPDDVRVPFFFGASQKSVSKDFLKTALKLGPRFLPVDIDGQGKNALDFHIAFYLGEYLTQDAGAECVILSRDKGFDPLVKHLAGRGFRVRRVGVLQDAFGATPARPKGRAARPALRAQPADKATADLVTRARDVIARLPVRNRPQKRQGLVKYLVSGLGRKHDESQVQQLVEQLVRDGVVREVNGRLTYS